MMLQFESADALFAHYAQVKLRIAAATPRRLPPPTSKIVKPSRSSSDLYPALFNQLRRKGSRRSTYMTARYLLPGPLRAHAIAPVVVRILWRFNVAWHDIAGSTRTANIVRPRQIIAWALAQIAGMSLPRIGSIMGGRDHTTILHAVRKIDAAIAGGKPPLDPKIMARIARMRAERDARQARGAAHG